MDLDLLSVWVLGWCAGLAFCHIVEGRFGLALVIILLALPNLYFVLN